MAFTTVNQIDNWKPKGTQEFKPCGHRIGLYVRGSESGSKIFYWRKAGRWFALGEYGKKPNQLSLADATERAVECNMRFKQGLKPEEIIQAYRGLESSTDAIPLEPSKARKGRTRKVRADGKIHTYEDAFEAYYATYGDKNLQAGPSRRAPLQWHSNVPDSFKAMPIADIKRGDIFDWMVNLLQEKHETGRKLRGLMDRVFEFAINKGAVEQNPVPPKRVFEVKKPKAKPHATIPPEELPAMWAHIEKSNASDAMKLLLKLTMLTAHRVAVNRLAKWEHFDLKTYQWVVPEKEDKETDGLMKSGRSHVVTLPQEFLDQLVAAKSHETYVFVNPKDGKPFSENAMLALVKRYDGKCTVHGLRNAIKIWGEDIAGFDDWLLDYYEDHREGEHPLDPAYRRRELEKKIAKAAKITEALYEYCKNG